MAWSPGEVPPQDWDGWPPHRFTQLLHTFVTAGSVLPGSGRAPPAAARSAGPTAHPYLGGVRRLAESVDIYYCSQESGARGGGGQAGRGKKEGGECGACGRPGCVGGLAKEAG